MNQSEYQEAEIVDESTTARKAGNFAQDQAFEYGADAVKQMRNQLLWAGFGSLFVFFLVLFVILAVVISLIVWLLPFAFAALVVAVLCMLIAGTVRAVYSFLRK